MGVSKNRGILTSKWMVYFNGKPYEQMDDLGGFPIFLAQHPYIILVMSKFMSFWDGIAFNFPY